MHTTEADTFQVVFFLISENGGREWTISSSTSCNWLVCPRYCQSKLAQVLKTRGYAQEAEQLLQRVVRGVMKLHSVT